MMEYVKERMVADKQQLYSLIDRLPVTEVEAAARYLEFLLARDEAPVDPEVLASIDAARANPSRPGIAHEEILQEFGLLEKAPPSGN